MLKIKTAMYTAFHDNIYFNLDIQKFRKSSQQIFTYSEFPLIKIIHRNWK